MSHEKLLCVYYNTSSNKNKDHLENHDRILVSINYLKSKLSTDIAIYENHTIMDYLEDKFNMTKEDISNVLLTKIYSNEYLQKIKNISNELVDDDIIDGDTYFSNVTYNEIIDNSIILFNVCYQICSSQIKYAYCLIRPPSHHAMLNEYNGFCIVNHTYLTAKYLHDKYSKSVLILDYDVHHGDGTQSLVNNNINDNIYFISMHCYSPGFYPGTGNEDENNEKVLNIPLKKGLNDDDYIEKFEEIVIPYINTKNIDIIIVSNGLDAHKDDPFHVMNLTNKFYVYVANYLKKLEVPLIYILEGGYNPETIGYISKEIIEEITG